MHGLSKIVWWFLVASGCCLIVLSAADDPNRPNVLVIIVDQFRYDMLQSVQNEMPRYNDKTKIRTPNLDRLRTQGVYFKNAYTQCAVCGPARAVFRTGKTLEANGLQQNELGLPGVYNLDPQFKNKIEAGVTFDMILVENKSYVAEHYGKWHLPEIFNWSQNGSTRIMTFNDADFTQMTNDADYGSLGFGYSSSNLSLDYEEKLKSVSAGLSETQTTGMQKDTYSKFPYVTAAIDVRHGLAPYSAVAVGQPDQQGRSMLPANKTSSYFEGTAAIGALDRLGGGSEPFVLTASFHNPHAPMVATGAYYDYYYPLRNDFFVPPNLSGGDLVNSPYKKHSDPDYQDSTKVKEWMVAYYALCEEVDSYVGKLLAKLDEHGITDNTIVVFTSDHGEALGAHGMREKNTFLEESAHVPLLIRYPGRIAAGLDVLDAVTSLDFFATILDYANAAQYDHGDGKSLRRFIENQVYNETYDEDAIVTEWDFRKPDGAGGLDRTLGGETNFMSMNGPWKLMLTKKASSTRLDALYHLENDPYEMANLVGSNGSTASDMTIGKAEHLKALLVEWMQRMDGPDHLYSDPVYNAGDGMGDIAEVSARRKWKTMNMWVSDASVEIGVPVNVAGELVRNEYVYLGRTTPGTLIVSSITVQGADAGLIELSGFTSGNITSGNYAKVKVTYRPAFSGQQIQDARIVINNNADTEKVVMLTSRDSSATSVPNANLVQNGSFEMGGVDPSYWNLSSSAVRATTSAQSGTYSLKIASTGSSGNTTQVIPTQNGRVYEISAWINAVGLISGKAVFDTLDQYDGPGQGQFVLSSPNAGWTKYSGSFTAASNSVTLRMFTDSAFAGSVFFDNIELNVINDTPLANPQSVTTKEDTAGVITLTGNDPDGDPLVYTIASAPAHGALSGTPPDVTYTPVADYNGSDSFSFRVNDGIINSANTVVSILVTPENDAPFATPQSVATVQNAAKIITLAGSDVDADALSYEIMTGPAHGILSGAVPNLTYTPNANYSGADSFTFRVNDGTVNSITDATVSIVVSIPVVKNLVLNPSFEAGGGSPTFWVSSGTAEVSTVSAQDGIYSLRVATTGSSGNTKQVIAIQTGKTYDISVWIHAAGLTAGKAVFDTLDVYDGVGQGQFVMNAANAGWTKYSGSFTATNTSVTLRMFTDSAFAGTVYFDNIVLVEKNDAPVASAQSVSTPGGTSRAILLTGSDADGNALTYALGSLPAHGSLTGTLPNVTYTPVANYTGSDSFTFTVNDGFVDSAAAMVSITVTPVIFSSWIDGFFRGSLDPTVIGFKADPDRDGLANGLEFVLGGNPMLNDAASFIPGGVKEGSDCVFTYKRSDASKFNTPQIVQYGNNLSDWTDVTIGASSGSSGGATYSVVGGTSPTNQDTIVVTIPHSGVGGFFVRLKVVQQSGE